MAWIQTYSGIHFSPFNPKMVHLQIGDIAHHLSLQCRFSGAVRSFYSVAQHSVLVSQKVPAEYALWGLLHDAAEAYLGDMAKPFKINMPWFRMVETDIMEVVAKKYKLSWPEPPEVKMADVRLLFTERRDLMSPDSAVWDHQADHPPYIEVISPWSPEVAEEEFLCRFGELCPDA